MLTCDTHTHTLAHTTASDSNIAIVCYSLQAPIVPNVRCNPADLNHPNCTEGVVPHAGNGAMTGRCAPEGRCEISGWCPIEMENTTITYVIEQLVVLSLLTSSINYF